MDAPPVHEEQRPTIEAPGTKAEEPLLSEMRREVAKLLGRKNISFPGAQPVSFARRHFQELKSKEYIPLQHYPPF